MANFERPQQPPSELSDAGIMKEVQLPEFVSAVSGHCPAASSVLVIESGTANPADLVCRTGQAAYRIASAGEPLPFGDRQVDVTREQGVLAFYPNQRQFISEQLRVTSMLAVMSECDWSLMALDSTCPDVQIAGNALVTYMLSVLAQRKHNTTSGRLLPQTLTDILTDPAWRRNYERQKVVHELPRADYRDLFLGTLDGILAGQGTDMRSNPFADRDVLMEDIDTVRNAQSVSIRLPAVVTEIVQLFD